MSPERRAALVSSRLTAAVGRHLGVALSELSPEPFANDGAVVVVDGSAWVDPGELAATAVGVSLAWAVRRGVPAVNLVLDPEHSAVAGGVARRGSTFHPAVGVWTLDGIDLVAVEPTPAPSEIVPAPATAEYVVLLEQAGVDVVVERGEVTGEIRGIEVARVVVDDAGVGRLEVGVGRFDQEAGALMHGDLSPPDALARVVAQVSELRRPGAEPHPLNRWARERWLRHQVVADPSLVGAQHLRPVESTEVRRGVRESALAAAVGHRSDGSEVVVACSVGIDLNAVPVAADIRASRAPEADLVIVVPTRDHHHVTVSLAERLARPASVVGLDGDWPG
ncbi:MAG: hypothetical protein ACXIVQ_08070 [Acidimicrobiales bacterium]